MNWHALLDPLGGAIVLGGTLAATLLRCGFAACGTAVRQLAKIGGPGFDFDTARAELAAQVEGIRREGILRAGDNRSSDFEMSDLTNAMVHRRSGAVLIAKHQSYRTRRRLVCSGAVEALTTAGDLAPIFGLAGTLFALSQLPREGLETGALMATVAMAVVTTLYGLLAAHVVFYPLARLVERRSEHEEVDRQRLVEWLEEQVAPASKSSTSKRAAARPTKPPTANHPIRRNAA